MSHDLGFFACTQGATTEKIRSVYLSSCEGNNIVWPSDKNFTNFAQELEYKYPQISSYSDNDVDDCPWSCDFDIGKGHLIVSMVYSRSQEIGNYIWELLQKNQVIVFDPQIDKAYLGNIELPESTRRKKWWKLWK